MKINIQALQIWSKFKFLLFQGGQIQNLFKFECLKCKRIIILATHIWTKLEF